MAGTTYTLETLPAPNLGDLLSIYPRHPKQGLWQAIRDGDFTLRLKLALVPRGWIYQNMVTHAKLIYQQTGGFDSPDNVIQPGKFGDISRQFDAIPWRYKFIAGEFVPNFAKAWQTTAYDQTMVNEAQIACALERYHLAHGEYPGMLDALVAQFMGTVPHDLIGGQPLHYRRTDDGKFLLYSVGWNETDDGGKPSQQNAISRQNGAVDYAKGDWVWPN